MLDWAITLGLMLCILAGGTMSQGTKPSFFRKATAEPLISQQRMQVGFAFLLASIVPFWREHRILGLLVFMIGLVLFVQGCSRLYRLGKSQARDERLARLVKDVAANDAVLDPNRPHETGKATKRKRRAARRAIAANDAAPSSRAD